MKIITALFLAASILSLQAVSAAPQSAPQSKKETIIVEGKMGIIKEQRIKSVQSTISFVPALGTASYDLIDISDFGANGFNEHIEAQEITIPSWILFSW